MNMSHDFSAEITNTNKSGTMLVHLKGELDEMSVEDLRKVIEPSLNDQRVNELIFDFSDLEFINSKGIGYIVSVHTHLAKDGRSMKIANANEPVMDVISLVGLTTIIPYHSTVEEAQGA